MKKIIYLLSGLFIIGLISCNKSANPFQDYANLKQGARVFRVEDISTEFNYNSFTTSQSNVLVQKYNNGVNITKLALFVSQKNSNNPSDWKLIRESDFSTDQMNLVATGQEVLTALGINLAAVEPGNIFYFYVRLTTDKGDVYDLTNSIGAIESSPNYQTVFRYPVYVICPFNADELFGAGNNEVNLVVKEDGWEDWKPDAIVTVYRGTKAEPTAANKISLRGVYGENAFYVDDLVVNIKPENGAASVPGVSVLSYSRTGTIYSARGYSNGAPSNTGQCGYVFSCAKYVEVTLNWYQGRIDAIAGNFGPYRLILTK